MRKTIFSGFDFAKLIPVAVFPVAVFLSTSAFACGGEDHEDKTDKPSALCDGEDHEDKKDKPSVLCGGEDHEDKTDKPSALCDGEDHEDKKDES